MRRTLSKAGQRLALTVRWLIMSLLSAAVLIPLALIISSEA